MVDSWFLLRREDQIEAFEWVCLWFFHIYRPDDIGKVSGLSKSFEDMDVGREVRLKRQMSGAAPILVLRTKKKPAQGWLF